MSVGFHLFYQTFSYPAYDANCSAEFTTDTIPG